MRRRGWSAGTIAMIIFTAVVLCCTAAVILNIRGGRENLNLDAERLSGSISALVASLQTTQEPAATANPAATQTPALAEGMPAPVTLPTRTVIPAQDAQTAAPRRTLTLTIGGAFVPSTRVYNGAVVNGQYDADQLFSGIADALHADMNIALLDVSSIGENTDWWAQAMKRAGFDGAVPLRDNTRGSTRLDVLSTLTGNGLTGMGAANNDQGFTLHTLNGVRLAALVYAEDAAQAGGLIQPYDGETAAAAIRQACAQGAQIVLVFMHWKKGTATEPTAAQRAIAQALSDAGVDLMIGTRIGTVFPVEYVYSEATGRNMLAAWSMGTLLSENRDDRAAVSGVLLHITLSCDLASQGAEFTRVEYTPCYCWGQEENGVFRYRVLQSALPAPATMVARQSEIMERALKLIQDAMNPGIAIQRK